MVLRKEKLYHEKRLKSDQGYVSIIQGVVKAKNKRYDNDIEPIFDGQNVCEIILTTNQYKGRPMQGRTHFVPGPQAYLFSAVEYLNVINEIETLEDFRTLSVQWQSTGAQRLEDKLHE